MIDIPSTGERMSFAKIYKVIPPGPKELKDVMGMATSEYQIYLENNWINELKTKYPVVLNQQGIDQLFK